MIPDYDSKECCICHKMIDDCWPPLCEEKDCEDRYLVEVNYNAWAKKEVERRRYIRKHQ